MTKEQGTWIIILLVVIAAGGFSSVAAMPWGQVLFWVVLAAAAVAAVALPIWLVYWLGSIIVAAIDRGLERIRANPASRLNADGIANVIGYVVGIPIFVLLAVGVHFVVRYVRFLVS
jgi:hypothetical protein